MHPVNFPFDRTIAPVNASSLKGQLTTPFFAGNKNVSMIQAFLHSPVAHILALGTSIVFTAIAALVPPNAGNFVAGVFLATFGSFLGGEEEAEAYESEIADDDV